MTEKDNVTYLNQRSKPDAVSRRVQARKLTGKLKDISWQHLRRIMQSMFDNADDTLFKIAEKANSGSDQNIYFDSMRIVRLQRETIEQMFFADLSAEFEEFSSDAPKKQKTESTATFEFDSLSLVSEEDLEISLAKDRLRQKIEAGNTAELSAIRKRLAYLFAQDSIDDSAIPFSAGTLVRIYAKAIKSISLELEIEIILLKLFDLQCVQGLAGLYQAINQELIDAGILPVIKTQIRTSPSTTGHAPATAVPNGNDHSPAQMHSAEPGDNLWGTLQGLIQQQRHSGGVIGGVGGNAGYTGGYAHTSYLGAMRGGASSAGVYANTPLILSETEMLDTLTDIQQQDVTALPTGDAHAVGNYLRTQLQTTSEGNTQKQIKPLDNDLIDVVSLIFEYILDDAQIPASAKSSIARLQIPMLKVAMLDKGFFSSHGHPARDLLNKLSRSAIGIEESADGDNPILAKIEDIVVRVINEFTDEMDIFARLEMEFDAFMDDYLAQETTALTDIGSRQKEREEIALAKAWVRETLEQHLLGCELPAVIVDIILGPWKDVMLQTYLQEGDQGMLWKTQIRFIDVLCWSVEPKQQNGDRTKLGHIIQQLITTLREGLVQIDYPAEEIEAIFTHLEPYHLASVRAQPVTHDEYGIPNSFLFADQLQQIEADFENMQAELNQLEIDAALDQKVILEDIVLEGWESSPDLESINDEYLELARHLEMGKWVEFNGKNGKQQRAKLAWKSDLLGEFTFLNWKFDVVADKSLLELAADFRQGTARIVDDVPLMDRALSAVMTTLTPKTG